MSAANNEAEGSSRSHALRRALVERSLRLVQLPRIALFRALSTADVPPGVRVLQPVQLAGEGQFEFEEGVTLGCFPSPLFLSGYSYLEARTRQASISIGAGTAINNDFIAIAEHTRIAIGERCFIGTSVEIYDSDFHGLKVADRRISAPEKAVPVMIEADVFLGSNVTVLKGARIGRGSVIASGSIVTGAIPKGVLAAGVPARVIKQIE